MKQRTAKTVEDVLQWIETTQHHRARWEEEHDRPVFFVMEGHRDRLRIPDAVHKQARGLITPGDRYDARMYRATPAGKARLTRYLKAPKATGEASS